MKSRPAAESGMDAIARRMESALVSRIGAARYALWFARHIAFIPSSRSLTVAVASAHFLEWLEQAFGEVIREAAGEVCGAEVTTTFTVQPALFGEETPVAPPEPTPTKPRHLFGEEPPLPAPPKPRRSKAAPAAPVDRTTPAPAPSAHRTAGRRWKQLNDFVVGSSNRVAHASALAVVEDPGQAANPLVLHGPVGTGKTHLLEGIYSGLRRKSPDARPCLVTAEEFTRRFVQATRFGKQAAFRRQFRECSALILDDLHFLATKRATQEEFLYTFDSLVADGRQVVLAMDCHPRLAEELMPELIDRLLGGAVWGLLPPDDETRLGILRVRATGASGPNFPDEVLTYLARNLRGNVRELEGAVNSVRHFAKVTSRAIDLPLVREAIGDLLRHTIRSVTVPDVDAAVCRLLGLSGGSLQSKARSWSVSHPRMIAIYMARKHTAATYGEIATHFGAKTHSSAVAAEKRVRAWIQKDEPLSLGERQWRIRDLLDRLERELQR